jgi:hypothetical protein
MELFTIIHSPGIQITLKSCVMEWEFNSKHSTNSFQMSISCSSSLTDLS